MSKKAWVWCIIALVIVAGAGFWGGMTYGATKVTTRVGTSGTFAGRAGATGFGGTFVTAGGGGTIGTVVQVGNGSFTVQLPSSTSTTASTGTKLILLNNATQIDELQSVPASNLQVGQTVTVAGSSNSDGSVTASNVMIRPATTRTGSAGSATTQTSNQ